MKKVLIFLRGLLPHITIALAVVLLALFILDQFNRAMTFINNSITKWMLAVFCVLVIIQAILFIIELRKRK